MNQENPPVPTWLKKPDAGFEWRCDFGQNPNNVSNWYQAKQIRPDKITAARELIRQLATEQIDPETVHGDLADLSNYIDDFMRPLIGKLP